MARINKLSLSYFPLDVDFLEDDKLRFISARFQHRGEIIAVRLLCKIYKTNGYYYKWGEDEALLFAKSVGGSVSTRLVNEVVHELVKRAFFDEAKFKAYGILTSNGIQQRYTSISKQLKRKVEIDANFNCMKKSAAGVGQSDKMAFEKEINELKQSCIDDSNWLNQTCQVYKTDIPALLDFCNNWILRAASAQKFGQYEIQTLIGFMMADFQKETGEDKKEKPGKSVSNYLEMNAAAKKLITNE